jgi:hypothetical protein
MTIDRVHRRIILRFAQPVTWLGMSIENAESLRAALAEKIEELKKLPE